MQGMGNGGCQHRVFGALPFVVYTASGQCSTDSSLSMGASCCGDPLPTDTCI